MTHRLQPTWEEPVDPTESLREIREDWRRIESKLLDMERRAYRLRCALREAGVPENLVRAIELGDAPPIRTEEERRKAPREGGS